MSHYSFSCVFNGDMHVSYLHLLIARVQQSWAIFVIYRYFHNILFICLKNRHMSHFTGEMDPKHHISSQDMRAYLTILTSTRYMYSLAKWLEPGYLK